VIYRVLEEITLLVHLVWILFLMGGVLFLLKGSRLAWLHFFGLILLLVLHLLGRPCPLTEVENAFHHLATQEPAYPGSFLSHYLEKVVYPEVPESLLRWLEIPFALLNLAAYALVSWGRIRRRRVGQRNEAP